MRRHYALFEMSQMLYLFQIFNAYTEEHLCVLQIMLYSDCLNVVGSGGIPLCKSSLEKSCLFLMIEVLAVRMLRHNLMVSLFFAAVSIGLN